MGVLTSQEVRLILEALEKQYGRGYSNRPEIARLQAKLSILAEVAQRRMASAPRVRDSVPCENGDSPA